MWSGLQNASSIAQLAGVDAFVLITAIVRAAQTARRNKKTCRELAEQVERIGGLLRSLEEHPGMGIMRRSETSAPLVELHETLRRACAVVESCRRGGYVRGLCAGGSRATSLRDLQSRIAFFLQLFPIISHLDSTRLLVQVIDSAAARAPTAGGEAGEGLQRSVANHSDPQDDDRVQNFSFSQLMNATNSFSFENQTEQGPLATLYKGQLHGNDVTTKKLSIIYSEGKQVPPSIEDFALKEARGFRYINTCKMEALGTSSLAIRMRGGFIVDWPSRFRIIEGVAQGAVYLHHHSRLRIIHRDLKPSNILLDSDMNPKIPNFDLAKVLSPGMIQDTAACVVGSVVKTDVYSFGVMVLEIISGKRWTRSIQETNYRDLLTWAFNRTPYGAKLVQRLKGFLPPSLHGISFCSRALPKCLSFPARRRTLSQQREMTRCVRGTVPFPRRPGYARESPIYAGDRSTTP
ncbi:hypothetical protein GQ55_2G090600 [Panicum hallii var. hallii]|uniref:non-specific serine/threonine protein kinase n=1 Tax=Panicum hallii var. hallii TaxID=1504633 RepID=A0A2T7EN02_9POAL|nr:hypothetical protein GQ55_2G090600 [Panicum hallii var. hallii]